VIIVDLTLGNSTLGGLSFVRRIRMHDPCTGMLVFTMHNDPVIVSRALELGATGYVLKDASAEEVLRAFRKVREGQRYISHGLASEVAFMQAQRSTNALQRMTMRELEILSFLAEGKPYAVIAEHLNVSYKTVANIWTQLKAKFAVRTLAELMRIAIQHLPSVTARSCKKIDQPLG
jgi:two-component system invasion response regulator UvrY